MEGHRGSSGAKPVVMPVLLTVIAALVLAACGGSSVSGTAASLMTPSTAVSPTAAPPAPADPARVARAESVVKAYMTAWNNARSVKRDRRGLLSLYADGVQYYDAAAIDTVITKSEMAAMNQDPDWWESFRLTLESSFVSADGRFAAVLGKIALGGESGDLPWQPAVSLLAIAADDEIVWECDYYGGEPGVAGQTAPMPAVPSGAVAPGSRVAGTALAASMAAISKWRAAFDDRDAASFLSFYGEDARYVDVVSPRWRVMTKSQLAADVASRFAGSEFASKLGPEPGSAADSAFFVSADGRFSAVQGTYLDEVAGGGLVDQPMLVILVLRAGQIVRQYNYVAMDRSLLQP
jgi:ketosteroid isomerase-like protein